MSTVPLSDLWGDRRQHPRINVGWHAVVGFANEWDLLPATLEDVSGGGACLRTKLPAEAKSELLVVLTLDDETIAALARVVWVETLDDGEFRLHLQFRWLQESSRRNLSALFEAGAADGKPA